jgi:hypothetical protein
MEHKHIPLAQRPRPSGRLRRIKAPCGHYQFIPDDLMDTGAMRPKCQQCLAERVRSAENVCLQENVIANNKIFGKEKSETVIQKSFLQKLFNF